MVKYERIGQSLLFYATDVIRNAYKMFGGEIKTGMLGKIPTIKPTIDSTPD